MKDWAKSHTNGKHIIQISDKISSLVTVGKLKIGHIQNITKNHCTNII